MDHRATDRHQSLKLAFAILLLAAGCKVVPPPAPPPPTPPPEPERREAAPTPAPTSAPTAPPKAAPAAPPKSTAVVPAPAAPRAAAPALDLRSLEQRLKETNAIGVLTKLSLKNQVDDLVAQFRAFHDGRQPPTLTELRRPYELLLMKVLSLLQDSDPALAKEINASREAIWSVLSDRNKLSQFL